MKTYFEKAKGFGVLCTADKNGKVDAAVYARPHVMEDNTLAFIMRDRLSYRNVQENPNAAYLFRQDGGGYEGVRLFLTRTGESRDPALLEQMARRKRDTGDPPERVVVFFRVDKTLPLVGDGPAVG